MAHWPGRVPCTAPWQGSEDTQASLWVTRDPVGHPVSTEGRMNSCGDSGARRSLPWTLFPSCPPVTPPPIPAPIPPPTQLQSQLSCPLVSTVLPSLGLPVLEPSGLVTIWLRTDCPCDH